MRRRFRLTPGGRHPHEPWFHIGTLEVSTTWLVVLLSIAGLVLYAVVGFGDVEFNLGLTKLGVVDDYKIWTLVTWPFAYWSVSLWDAVAIFFFWYFGSDLERSMLGRNRFAWMLLLWTVVLGAVMVAITAIAEPANPLGAPLYGLNLLELMLLLLWIAEWPQRTFFFNIPAWVLGLVIVGIQVIQYLGTRNWTLLVDFLVGIVLCAIIARSFGMLSEYSWLPRVALPHRRPRPPRAARRDFDPGRPTVVSGPWSSQPTPPHVPSRDEQRMDELLDKIHAHGTDSLTDAERAELLELRARRRRGS